MKPILIQGAMEVEISHFISVFQATKEEKFGTYVFYHGAYQGYPVILSRTKIGMAHCAAATALGISQYQPSMVLNQGIAGAHTTALKTGDIVLGEKSVSINAFEKPVAKKGVYYKYWLDGSFFTDDAYHSGNENLLKIFDHAEYSEGTKIQGVLGSGDVWNREWEFIDWLHSTRGSHCEDMETLAMYQVAEEFSVAKLGVRMISNNELLEEEYQPETALTLQKFIVSQMPQLVSLAKGEL